MRAPAVIMVSALAHGALFAMLAQIAQPGVGVSPERLQATRNEPRAADDTGLIEVVMLPATATATPPAASANEAAAAAHALTDNAARLEPGVSPAAAIRETTDNPVTSPRPSSAAVPPTATDGAAATGISFAAAAGTRAAGEGAAVDGGAQRRATGIDLALGAAVAERIAAAGRRRVEPKVSGKLESTPGGGAVVHDLVATMTVERDGNISFKDKPDIELPKLKLPVPDLDLEDMREDLGKMVTDWYRDPYAGTKFGPSSEVSRVWMAVPGACNEYGETWCDDELAPKQEKTIREQRKSAGGVAGGTGDISAALQRKYVGDPYASRKLGLIDDTRDERVERGSAYRKEQLDKSLELVHRTLRQLWTSERDPVRRKEALFELWDDCDEGEGPRGEAGQRARAMVIGWIRSHLPVGSPGAFSAAEIAELQRRRASKQAFVPY